jgi:hypothetical protein
MIKFLKKEDIPQCLDIALSKERIGGSTANISKDSFLELYGNYFNESDDRYTIGYYEDDDQTDLISFMCIGFFENKTRGKFWLIRCIYTKKNKSYFTFNTSEIGLLVKTALELAESKEYYEYYYCTAERISHVYERQWAKNQYFNTNRYELITLDVIPPNTMPTQQLYQQLMGFSTKSDTIVFKKRILRPEYRK